MYINIAASRLLTPTYCTHTEIFLREAGIIFSEVNVIFEKYEKVLQYDPKDMLNKLNINEN